MKYFLSIFLLFICLNHLSAQEKHFIFIQSDAKQPFYVSLNGKLYSSTASGYLIIPKLSDGNYNFTVGFAQNSFPEQNFSYSIQNKDLGFELKNFNEKGWGLFNLQGLDITMATSANSNVVGKALSENAAAKAPVEEISFNKKKDTTTLSTKAIATSELTAAAKTETNPVAKVDSLPALIVNPTKETATDVKKVSEVAAEEGVHLSYVEGEGKTKDTINVIIPVSTDSINTSIPVSAASNKNNMAAAKVSGNKAALPASKNEPRFLDINISSQNKTTAVAPAAKEERLMENSNCKNIATEDDYWKLRKKMSMVTTDEKMIVEAKKFYRVKCFTTNQIKGLSTLFLSDEGRYKFFDASFVSVADANQYATLQSEFIDPAFATRFKNLIQ